MKGLPTCHLPANPLFFQSPSLSPHFEGSAAASSAGPVPPGNWTKMPGRPCSAGWITQTSLSCLNPALEGLSTLCLYLASRLPGRTSWSFLWLLGRVFFHNGWCGIRGISLPLSNGPTLPCSSSGDDPSEVQHLQARSNSRVALKSPSLLSSEACKTLGCEESLRRSPLGE